jgi:hypothetical protein
MEKSKKRSVICPSPPEHFIESANENKDLALNMDIRFADL